MSEPEIARRCTACGASIRDRALFCPQCGHTLADKGRTTAELVETEQLGSAEAASAEVENKRADVGRTVEIDPETVEPRLTMHPVADATSDEVEPETAEPESAAREIETEKATAETRSSEVAPETEIAEPAASAELTDDVVTDAVPLNSQSLPSPEQSETVAPPWPDRRVRRPPSARPYPAELDKRHRLQRAAAGARDALEDGAQRVERIRKISSVVIDQASYDPSLRFILIAAALFIVFLTILIMSKLIG